MKVLQVSTHLNIGGITNYMVTLAKAINEKGHYVIVATSGGDMEKELDRCGASHRRVGLNTKNEFSPKVLAAIFKLSKIIKDEKVDIVHAHTRVSQVACFFACRIAGVPYVTTCHGFFKKRLRSLFDTWGVKVIAISDAVKAHLIEDLSVKEDRIELIYSGVDVDRFSKDYSRDEVDKLKGSIGLNDGPVIGTIGRLSPVKGQRFLIEAMADIITQKKDVQCLIVGNGPEEKALRDMVKSLKIERSIHFASADPDTHKFLSIMDVFVFPSVKEGLGIALLEALASGKSCVASDVGGIGDIIKDGYNGLLTPVGDVAGLAEAISSLLDNADLRKKMEASGRALVKEKFSLDSMGDSVINLYKKVLTK